MLNKAIWGMQKQEQWKAQM